MKKLLVLSLVLLLGVTCMAKTNYFDAVYIEGALTLSGTSATSFTGTTFAVDASSTVVIDGATSVRGVSAGFTSLESPANRFGVSAAIYMQIATAATTGITTITHTGSAPTVTWTANSFDLVGALAADALTLSDVLTFSDGATIDNTAADTLTITETNIDLVGALAVDGVAVSGAVGMLDDQLFTIGTTTATAATVITAEFDETTTGVGSFQMGTAGVPQVLNTNPGAAVIPFSVNILHSAGAGDCDDLISAYAKAAMTGAGDSDTTIVGGAFRAYVGTALGTTVVDEVYGIQPWAKHDGTGDVTALSGVSALVDVNTDNFTATTVNAGHFHVEGAATVTGQFDGVMVEIYPDVTNLDAGFRVAVNSGATVADGIAVTGAATDGIDLSGATLTADFKGQNGETISNATDGEIDFSSASLQVNSQPVVLNTRHRVTTAEINAGHEILPAITGRTYRIVDVKAIAYGGAVGATTTVDVLGTQGTASVKLVTFAQADLVQSAVLDLAADGTVLADGASFVACDAASAITVGKTGSDVTTATGVDFIITYVIE